MPTMKTYIGNVKGPQGEGVTITSIAESTEDGGSNVVEFSDGKTLTVKNGKPGEAGYTPVKGTDYFDGNDGTSVTVASITESDEDGGSNVVTFSDGNTMNVKNGKQGKAGDTPEKGTDYWTSADKAEIVNDVIAALNTEDWTFTLEDGSTTTKAVYVG